MGYVLVVVVVSFNRGGSSIVKGVTESSWNAFSFMAL